MKKTKLLSLEKEGTKIMNHYAFDVYNKQLYIKNCLKAIEKVVLEMIGDDQTIEFKKFPGGKEVNVDFNTSRNILRQEIRDRILGKINVRQFVERSSKVKKILEEEDRKLKNE